MHPSTLEIVLVLVLILASIAAFRVRLGSMLHALRGSRRTPGFKLGPLGPRVRRFIWEVLLQGEVIRFRPLAGIAHAFVFWGFCAFALITLNHFAIFFGVPFLTFETAFGRFYFGFVAIFAVTVAVSIAGLSFRRYVLRPVWLGKVSLESGIIAFLIFTLMVTYLLALRFPEETVPGRVNWWVHTLALLVFLPIIPRTKHLHLLLSPITVFLERNGFSAIPPLEGDEDFGLDTGKDVTRIDALQAFTCVECGRCTEACPAYTTGKILNPKEIILGMRRYLNEFSAGSEQPLIGKHISAEAVFQCTTCGGCEFHCPVGIQHLPVMIGLRRGMVNTGKWDDEYGGQLFNKLERNGNSLGFAAAERQKFIERNQLPYFDGTQEYCLWLGCMGAYDPQGREIILALVRIMQHLGLSFGVLRKEKCNGDPVRRLGNDYLFSEVAQANIETLNTAGAKKLISICPHCVRTIGEDWKEVGASFEIEHHTELLARFASRLPSNGQGSVAFHDPCYLGRYRGIYDDPRRVAERAGSVIDPPRSRDRAFCCGAGGGLMFLGEEKGKRINVERTEELVRTGAEVIATACPFCQTMFRDALGAVTQHPPKLLDVAQIAAASLPDRARE